MQKLLIKTWLVAGVIICALALGPTSVQARSITVEEYTELLKDMSNHEVQMEFIRDSINLQTPVPKEIIEAIDEGLEPDIAMTHSYEYKKALYEAARNEMIKRNLLPKETAKPESDELVSPEEEPLLP